MSRQLEPLGKRCYLCGEDLTKSIDDDHVPPKQIFPKELRSTHNPDLQTLPTHEACNSAYQFDEEYFVHSVAPLAKDSYSGSAMLWELISQYRAQRNVPLSHKILGEFDPRPSGLYLPSRKVVKRFDPQRFWRVVWKIARGLFAIEYQKFLPEDTPRSFQIVDPDTKPPDLFYLIPDETRGAYPGVFDYKFAAFPEHMGEHLWAMLFWDRLIMLVLFHDPECSCDVCLGT